MTLNDLECPIHLKVDGTLDVRLLRGSGSTIRIGVAREAEGEWARGPIPPQCGQLTRCFSAVAELLVKDCESFCNCKSTFESKKHTVKYVDHVTDLDVIALCLPFIEGLILSINQSIKNCFNDS